MKKVSIILVNYNGSNDTIACVESLKDISYDNYHVIIVDNASNIDDYNSLKQNLDKEEKVKIIRSEKNLGFSGGNNLGIKYGLETLNSDYVLLLNNDTLVEPDFLNELVRVGENDTKVGIVGSKIFYYPDKEKIWFAGGAINWKKYITIHFGEKELDSPEYNVEKEIEFITGCVMLIKKEVIAKVGLLPDEYFMYYEDVDFCVSTKEKGYKLMYCPKSVVYHKVSASSGGEQSPFFVKYFTRNRLYFTKKFKHKVSTLNYIYTMTFFYSTRMIKIMQYALRGDKKRMDAVIQGLREKVK